MICLSYYAEPFTKQVISPLAYMIPDVNEYYIIKKCTDFLTFIENKARKD